MWCIVVQLCKHTDFVVWCGVFCSDIRTADDSCCWEERCETAQTREPVHCIECWCESSCDRTNLYGSSVNLCWKVSYWMHITVCTIHGYNSAEYADYDTYFGVFCPDFGHILYLSVLSQRVCWLCSLWYLLCDSEMNRSWSRSTYLYSWSWKFSLVWGVNVNGVRGLDMVLIKSAWAWAWTWTWSWPLLRALASSTAVASWRPSQLV